MMCEAKGAFFFLNSLAQCFSSSDTALQYLFKLFSSFISLVAKVLPSPGLYILTFSQYLPKTLVTALELVSRFIKYLLHVQC